MFSCACAFSGEQRRYALRPAAVIPRWTSLLSEKLHRHKIPANHFASCSQAGDRVRGHRLPRKRLAQGRVRACLSERVQGRAFLHMSLNIASGELWAGDDGQRSIARAPTGAPSRRRTIAATSSGSCTLKLASEGFQPLRCRRRSLPSPRMPGGEFLQRQGVGVDAPVRTTLTGKEMSVAAIRTDLAV